MPQVDVTGEAAPTSPEKAPRRVKCWGGCGEYVEPGSHAKVQGVEVLLGVSCAKCYGNLVAEGKREGDNARQIAKRAFNRWVDLKAMAKEMRT